METSAETSSPINIFDIETTPRKVNTHRRNLTNITLFDLALDVVPSRKTQKTEYENQLHQESIDWSHLLKHGRDSLARATSNKVIIDKSVLSQEQLAYIERTNLIDEFAKGSENFLANAKRYLEEYQKFIELQEQLVKLTQQQVNGAAYDLVYDCKYRTKHYDSIS